MALVSEPEITPPAARQFLNALLDGVPPHSPLTSWLTVNQESLIKAFHEDLKAVARGDFRSLLLLGNPGAGKSQLLITLEYLAKDQGFVTAYFSQDVQSKLAFNRPDQIYRRIIETVRLPDDFQRGVDPFQEIMDKWVDQSLPMLKATNRSMAIAYRLGELGFLPSKVENIHPRTRVALVGYLMASEQQNQDARFQFLNVLRGPGPSNTRLLEVAKAVNLQRRGFIGYTPSAYDDNYYFGQLGTIIFILRSLGYHGMAVLFDEVTAIIDLGSRSREKAYKVLDSLFFNRFGHQGLYTVFAYMPPFITQLRADQRRMGQDYVNRWRSLMDQRMLELAPLDKRDMQRLLRRISYLHGVARGWPAWAIMKPHAGNLAAAHQRNGLTTRELVREGLNLLDHWRSDYR